MSSMMNQRQVVMHTEPNFFQGRDIFMPPKPRSKWKSRNANKRTGARRNFNWKSEQHQAYEPPRLSDLQYQNSVKTTRFFPKRFKAPRAPRNTTSFIMRAKKSGGIAPFVSPAPVTPAVIPTPMLSPAPRYREGLADEVNKEWGVNGYGSMNGLIRLRSNLDYGREDDSERDADQIWPAQSVQQLERRLDQDLCRFEMIYSSNSPENNAPNLLETQMDDQNTHIAHLEEENLTLKESLYLMQQELDDLRRRMQMLEGGVSDEQAEVCSEKSIGDVSCACD